LELISFKSDFVAPAGRRRYQKQRRYGVSPQRRFTLAALASRKTGQAM